MSAFVVAVDGPSASGKSSICAQVCRKLSWSYINTGALYRSIAWLAIERGVDLADENAMQILFDEFEHGFSWDGFANKIYFNKQDLNEKIHSDAISGRASIVAKSPKLRQMLLPTQRKLANLDCDGVVLDGRDIGTVVFPDADLKIFMTASLDQRARRRWMQILQEPHDDTLTFEHIKNEIKKRDIQDSQRETAPLRKASDYVELNTDHLSLAQSIDALSKLILDAYEGKNRHVKR